MLTNAATGASAGQKFCILRSFEGANHGVCYLSSPGRAFDGGAESARVYIDNDGYWYLQATQVADFWSLERQR